MDDTLDAAEAAEPPGGNAPHAAPAGLPTSGVGVVDKAFGLLAVIRSRPCTLAELVERTGFSRATVHRIAAALEVHGMVRRDDGGRYHIGLASLGYADAARRSLPLASAAQPALAALRDSTQESAQLYVRDGDRRVCVASLESPHGLRTIVGSGAVLPLEVGSGGRVLRGDPVGGEGWLDSVAEREAGVASVSAPVCDRDGTVVAAIGVSGPVDRLGERPGRTHGAAVRAAARAVETAAGLR